MKTDRAKDAVKTPRKRAIIFLRRSDGNIVAVCPYCYEFGLVLKRHTPRRIVECRNQHYLKELQRWQVLKDAIGFEAADINQGGSTEDD